MKKMKLCGAVILSLSSLFCLAMDQAASQEKLVPVKKRPVQLGMGEGQKFPQHQPRALWPADETTPQPNIPSLAQYEARLHISKKSSKKPRAKTFLVIPDKLILPSQVMALLQQRKLREK